MQHKFYKDKDGNNAVVGGTDGYPYCMYWECMFCGDWFCSNGCDRELNDDCEEVFETLFEWEPLVRPRETIYD